MHSLNNCDQSKHDNLTLAKLCFPTFTGAIWNERNNHIFRNKNWPWQLTLNDVLYQVGAGAILLGLHVSPFLASAWDMLPRAPQTYVRAAFRASID